MPGSAAARHQMLLATALTAPAKVRKRVSEAAGRCLLPVRAGQQVLEVCAGPARSEESPQGDPYVRALWATSTWFTNPPL